MMPLPPPAKTAGSLLNSLPGLRGMSVEHSPGASAPCGSCNTDPLRCWLSGDFKSGDR